VLQYALMGYLPPCPQRGQHRSKASHRKELDRARPAWSRLWAARTAILSWWALRVRRS